ncbi:MAG: triacylglycerol lipase, partial [Solirubrobacteraceae bacterium]|nr:triacylglycerol lipase [Solirubrobacteraceae bacterium]
MQRKLTLRPRRGVGIAAAAAAMLGAVAPAAVAAPPRPANDPFYTYTGGTPLAQVSPGTVLSTRTRPFRVAGIATPIRAVQLLYRSTGQLGQPTTNVTSVLLPPVKPKVQRVFSYQSFYDSLNPDDQPSYAVSGGTTLGGAVNTVEVALFAPWLLQGYTVNLPDTQGQQANFASGPEYGLNTLDSLRATFSSRVVNLPSGTKAGLFGYSGGAIATGWAAELAPSYAPDVDARLVGAAMGGVLVSPANNLRYVEGSTIWAGVMPMAIIGASRAFG